MRYCLLALAAVFISGSVFADEIYKIADENGYIDYCGCPEERIANMREAGRAREIAKHIMHKRFSPEFIRSQFYQLNTTRGIIWQGDEIVQYDYKPLSKDRFRHLFWVNTANSGIVKLEIYDDENKLLFRGLNLNGADSPNHKFEYRQDRRQLQGGYFGFVNIHREMKGEKIERLLFTDGLSRFSVFRAPPEKGRRSSEKLVVYGNYIYSITTDNSSYTVVGSVPFSFMEDVVSKLDSNDEEFKSLIDEKKSSDKK
ncbi:MAG: MucB/RseB C-terminal domain-containing protein [Deferribacteraceae bacterium]|jgi:hypothetical protein|nr:MucB/RseB C-terminal domain-containing protein [Deferribacteraceae bacterium]